MRNLHLHFYYKAHSIKVLPRSSRGPLLHHETSLPPSVFQQQLSFGGYNIAASALFCFSFEFGSLGLLLLPGLPPGDFPNFFLLRVIAYYSVPELAQKEGDGGGARGRRPRRQHVVERVVRGRHRKEVEGEETGQERQERRASEHPTARRI